MEIFRIKGAGKISEEARCLSAPTLGVRVPSFCRFGSDPVIFSVRSFAFGVASEYSSVQRARLSDSILLTRIRRMYFFEKVQKARFPPELYPELDPRHC
ncbi:MAG: hypothetical protein UT41_C0001G0167 [Candidatus Wolfebacteria bacterium GW2011_GWC2_39_22]|uniref:Uncharacterized protein n=1 Tax=Candidatus Wolfebacteria bacterium GW2011_GWC2_39_22 TaxID=1619013 RepID=A0A0G0NB01_9BACT|nr:MAG: hypothetical protein UT41_C0001G0167 [Candidatus Wolfebacteria bacterium GW2011_GWC2_39_22]